MGNLKKTPTVYQMEATECGAASLSMILAYFGRHMALEQMRVETGVSRDGCSAGNIMRAAKKFGLDCHGYRREPDELRRIKVPCIIHWNFNHFVVFEGIRGSHAYLNDPASGRRRVTMDELDEGFTGIILTFDATDRFLKGKKAKKLSSLIRERLKGYGGVLFKLLYIGLLLVFPGLALPVLSQVLIDDILVTRNTSWFGQFLLFMGAVIILKAGLTFYRSRIIQKLQNKMSLMSGLDFLDHLFRLPIEFFDQRYVGDLTSRVDSNNKVSSFLAGDLAETFLNMVVASFFLALLLLYSPVLTAVGIVGVVVNLMIVRLSSRSVSNLAMKLQQDQGKLVGVLCAGLNITGTLKASGAEGEYISRIIGYNAKTICLEQRLSRLQQVTSAIPAAVGKILDVVMLTLGATSVINGDMTLGMLLAFTTLFASFLEPIEKLVEFVKRIQEVKADMCRVEDIMNYPADAKFATSVGKREIKTKLQGNVELDGVSFGYGILAKPLIEGLSFKLSSGRSIAFVGSSGCGKSTISKVISGLYRPWSGEVRFDGIPLAMLPNEVVNASISTVSQHITLFSGTIRENLTMWNLAILDRDVIAAAKDACIHDVITTKPGAYNYRLNEGASNLSGGQRQRLEIARALVTNPTILVMDEATSALDPVIEKQIIDNIKRRGCTCIIVAHRLSAIRDCDQIIVMERGRVVQSGSHDDLSKVDGHYKALIRNA